MKTALLLTNGEITDEFRAFLRSFGSGEFDAFLVVAGGPRKKAESPIEGVAQEGPFEIVSKRRKGSAVRFGIRRLLEFHPDLDCIVVSDGRYSKGDIESIENECESRPGELILGSSDPSQTKSRLSSFAYRMLTGKRLRDPQSGLMGIPKNLFRTAIEAEGSRLEYHDNFLLDASSEASVHEIRIESSPKGRTRSVEGALLLAKKPLLYALVSLGSFFVDLGLFSLLVYVLFPEQSEFYTALSTVLARVLSGGFNFLLLRYVVFRGKENTWFSAVKYLILFLVNMALSASITAAFTSSGQNLAFLKVLIDAAIAVINYLINRLVIFRNKAHDKRGKKAR